MAKKETKKRPVKGKRPGSKLSGKKRPSGAKPKKGRPKSAPKNKKKDSKKAKKPVVVTVPTNRQEKLVDIGAMREHNFMSSSEATLTRIYPMKHVSDRRYEVSRKEKYVSTILKLVLSVVQTNEMNVGWSQILWNISQRDGLLPDGAKITFVRAFERKDSESARKEIMRRRKLAVLSSDSEDNIKRQSAAVAHDRALVHAIDSGDSVVSFGAEAIITAPDDQVLEKAVNALKDYLNTNDETRGMKYEIDLNKQARPFLIYGPNSVVGNKDVFVDMTSEDAGETALFVDSGGDRTPGSEYIGVSVGKLIRSHAAYNLRNHRSLYVGNDTKNQTHLLTGPRNEPSQIYMSKVASRAYLLAGKSVTHIVADHVDSVDALYKMPIHDDRKVMVDVSKGLLNIMEVIDTKADERTKERLVSRFAAHLDNIIALFSQFRDKTRISTTDEFASITRDILTDFYISKKYWSREARNDTSVARLIGIKHEQFATLSDFGQYVVQRKKSNNDTRLAEALFELENIVVKTILETIPSLDKTTDGIVDDLVESKYRIVDLTGTVSGALAADKNPTMNVMMISYLNVLLPILKNGDVILIHGVHKLSSIAKLIDDAIAASGVNVDIVYTESNQNVAVKSLNIIEDELDFIMVDLYENRVDKLVKPLRIDSEWSTQLSQSPASYFIKTKKSLDYIFLDSIL